MSTQLGGGDLDGDEYNVIPLANLPEFRPTRTSPAALYDPAPRKELNRPCNQVDIANFIVEYILSDVSLRCTSFPDREPLYSYMCYHRIGSRLRLDELARHRRPRIRRERNIRP